MIWIGGYKSAFKDLLKAIKYQTMTIYIKEKVNTQVSL